MATSMLGATGCGVGGNFKPATGTVTYKGAPVEGVTVVFAPEKGPTGYGLTDASGKYTITTDGKPGAPLGINKVFLSKTASAESAMPSATPSDMIKGAQEMGAKGKRGGTLASKSVIPAKYSLPDNGLKAEVGTDAAKNVFDFALTD
jgi:hypothetical protein